MEDRYLSQVHFQTPDQFHYFNTCIRCSVGNQSANHNHGVSLGKNGNHNHSYNGGNHSHGINDDGHTHTLKGGGSNDDSGNNVPVVTTMEKASKTNSAKYWYQYKKCGITISIQNNGGLQAQC